MKERIEFVTEGTTKGRKEIAKINEYVNNFNFDCEFKRKIEQVPETFEELKEMCKKEDMSKCDDEIKIKWHNNTSLFFYEKDGEIICKDEDSCIEMIIGYDRTPSQMWTIIKNL